MNNQSSNSGFSLIELMVTLAIGVLVTGAGLTVYSQVTASRNHVQAEVQIQESGYFITQTLKRYVNQAGYRPLDTNTANYALFPVKTVESVFAGGVDGWSEGEYIRVVDNGFEIRFSGVSDSTGTADGSMVNCSGEAVGGGVVSVAQFNLVDGSINCTSDATTVELIGELDGVRAAEIKVYWGVDIDNDLSVDEYRDSDEDVVSGESIESVRIKILVESVLEVLTEAAGYTFDDQEYTSPDRRIRREYISTIKLKV